MLYSIAEKLASRKVYVYGCFWLIAFAVYLPAAHAGFVSDTTGWLQSLRQDSFADYINRSRFGVKSMYQLTQLNTWLLYQLLGVHRWAWHLLFISLHASCCLLLFVLGRNLFRASGIARPALPSLAAAALFCISPYASEVVVWEASFHYLQAFILTFSILILVQHFQSAPNAGRAVAAGLLFCCATFTHELWYLTLPFTFTLACYYRLAAHSTAVVFRRTLLYFSLPQLLLFLLHLGLFRLVYGAGIAHVGAGIFKNPPEYFYTKLPWYLFHLFAWGRFFPENIKRHIYDIFRHPGAAVVCYGLVLCLLLVVLARFRRLGSGRAAVLLAVWLLLAIGIYVPLWFPDSLWVVCDRYTYFMLAFQWLLVAVLLFRLRRAWLRHGLLLVLLGVNGLLLLKVNRKWQRSDEVITAIQTSPVLKPGRVKLLLNSPACLRGIPMIGSSPEGEYRLMHNLLFSPPIPDSMLDVVSYNLNSPGDGAQAEVVNDSTVKVTLNQWGTWWWLGGFGAYSYEHPYYRVDMVDAGHWYNLILKKPYDRFQLLYQTGRELREVDMQRRGVVQN